MQVTQEQLDYLKKQHLHILIPAYGGQLFECVMTGLIRFSLLASKIGMQFSLDTMTNESLITRGRNNLVAKFMFNKDATHLMFIDSDIGFNADYIFQMLLHDKDLIGGLYPKKNLPIDFVVNVDRNNVLPNGQVQTVNGLIKVTRVGTGFMIVKRSVIDKMFAAYPELKFKGNIGLDPKFDPFMYALFDTGIDPETLEYLSEDYDFCQKWAKLGGEIFADSTVRLSHNGFFKFDGQPEELMKRLGVPEDHPCYHARIAVAPVGNANLTVSTANANVELTTDDTLTHA